MADVNISKYRASVVRDGSKPASPGFVVSEGQNPTDPAGSGQNHLPVTIAPVSTGLAITDNQILSGAGTVAQYIRGDGSLADFPESSGGGSSVSYYLNGSVNQGTIGGVAYRELSKVPILGAGTDFTINANGYIASFITDAGDPNLLEIPGGNWNFETYFSASSGGGSPSFYVELYKVSGTTATLIASSSSVPELIAFGTNLTPYFSTLAVPTTTLALTDRLAVRYYVNNSGRTITMHTENNHLCQIITTFTTGLTALNGLTAQVQNFAVGTSGSDFNIASATATHTFNLPTASATNRGALSSSDWTTFNNKQNALGYVPVPETRTLTINGVTQDLSANRTFNVGTVTSVGLSSATSGVTIGSTPVTSSGTITLAIATASGSQQGLLSSTDWTTFNNKQNALTNPVTGTGTTNRLAKFTGASTIGNSNITDIGSTIFNENPVAGQFAWQFNGNTTTGLSFGASVVAGTNSSDIAFRVLNAAASSNYFVVRGDGAATFSSSVTATQYTAQADSAYYRVRRGAGTDVGYITDSGTWGDSGTDFTIGASSANLRFYVNNNTIERMRIFSDGNVFIGTSPSNNGARLQVSGRLSLFNSASTASILINNTSNGWGFTQYQFNSTDYGYIGQANALFSGGSSTDFGIRAENNLIFGIGSTERMRLNSSGNLGLGVTPSAWATTFPSFKAIEVGFAGNALWSAGAVDFTMTSNAFFDGSWKYAVTANATRYQQADGIHRWFNAPSGTAGNTISFTQAMTLTSSGNLLVGTTTDNGARLQVSGTSTFSSSVTAAGGLISNGGSIGYGGGELGFNVTTSGATSGIYTTATGSPILYFDHRATGNTGFWVWRSGTGGATTALTLSNVGAATFSSSVRTGAPAGGTSQPWRLGTVATVSPTSPNRTIEVEVNGTTYYLHAKTTNN